MISWIPVRVRRSAHFSFSIKELDNLLMHCGDYNEIRRKDIKIADSCDSLFMGFPTTLCTTLMFVWISKAAYNKTGSCIFAHLILKTFYFETIDPRKNTKLDNGETWKEHLWCQLCRRILLTWEKLFRQLMPPKRISFCELESTRLSSFHHNARDEGKAPFLFS